jgi:lipopolysaccharide biosynthesis glycosyltransferase
MRWRLERGRRLPAYIYDGTAGAYLDEVLKLPAAARPDYFNAGVMLLDLHALRRIELKRRAFEFWTREMQRLLNFDQCILNHLFAADYKILDPKWNAMTPVGRQRLVREMILRRSRPAALQLAALSHPAIVHFASNKPWNHSSRPRAGLWWANALASPIAGDIVGWFIGKSRPSFRTAYSLALTPFQILRELPTLIRTRSRMRKQEREASLHPPGSQDRRNVRHEAVIGAGTPPAPPIIVARPDAGSAPTDATPVEIAFFFDSGFVTPATVAIASVLANSNPRRSYVVHVFHLGTDTEALAPLVALERPDFKIEAHDLMAGIKRVAPEGWPDEIYFHRMLLGDLLPRSPRVLYLDTDTVATSDMAELFDTPLGGAPLGACIDVPVGRRRMLGRVVRLPGYTGTVSEYMHQVLGLSDEAVARYFNSGVLLLDLDRARDMKLSRAALEIISGNRDRIWLHDQCILNRLFARSYRVLDPCWNALVPTNRIRAMFDGPSGRKQLAILADAKIIHFGGSKPWNQSTRPAAGVWWAYALASPVARAAVRACLTSPRAFARSLRLFVVTPFQIVGESRRFLRARRLLAKR